MRYTYATPPPFPAVQSGSRLEEALVRDARRLLHEVVSCTQVSVMLDRDACRAIFATPMAKLCVDARLLNVPIERLLIAIKEAWVALPGVRMRLGDVAPDVLASAITVCIEQYFEGSVVKR